MKTTYSNPDPDDEDDLVAEYTFDYAKAKPNRFVTKDSPPKMVIVLDEDIAQIFSTSEAVNQALRKLIETVS